MFGYQVKRRTPRFPRRRSTVGREVARLAIVELGLLVGLGLIAAQPLMAQGKGSSDGEGDGFDTLRTANSGAKLQWKQEGNTITYRIWFPGGTTQTFSDLGQAEFLFGMVS